MPDTQFELALDQFLAEAMTEAEHFAPQIAEQLLVDILRGSPYWSGKSKASWVFSLNEAVVKEASDVPKRIGGIAELDAEQRSLATLGNLSNFKLGDTIFLSQGTTYLGLIEAGTHGDNAGFVAAALSKYFGIVSVEVTL